MVYFSILHKFTIATFIPVITSFRKYNTDDDFYVFYDDNEKFYQPLLKLGVTKLLKIPNSDLHNHDDGDFSTKSSCIDYLCTHSDTYFTYVSPFAYFLGNPTKELSEIVNSNSFYSILGCSYIDETNSTFQYIKPVIIDGMIVFNKNAMQAIKDMLDDVNFAKYLQSNAKTDVLRWVIDTNMLKQQAIFLPYIHYLNIVTSYLSEFTDFKYNKKVISDKFNAKYYTWNKDELPIMANFDELFISDYSPLVSKSFLNVINSYKQHVKSLGTVKGYSTQYNEFKNKVLSKEFEV